MPKQIALFIDGTFNSDRPGAKEDTTNVRKLFAVTSCARKYLEGVGGYGKDAFQGATGLGTSKRIREAYRFLCENYRRGDSIYLFGFSRGAFAVRSLAGFAFRVGLLLDGNNSEVNLKRAWKAYLNPRPGALRELRKLLSEITGHDRPAVEETDLPIHFIGVWDTVPALGSPFTRRPPEERFALFHRHELPRNVNHARHALALHECRHRFEPLLFTKMTAPQRQTLEQMWFSGAHADVGGGYPHSESGYSKIALLWMAREAKAESFQCDVGALEADFGCPAETMHQELKFDRWGVRPALKNRNELQVETRQSFRIHSSVLGRLLTLGPANYAFRTALLLSEIDALSVRLAIQLSPWQAEITSALAMIGMSADLLQISDVAAAVEQFKSLVERPFSSEIDIEEGKGLTLWVALALCNENKACLGRLVTSVRDLSRLTAHPQCPKNYTDLDCARVWLLRVQLLSEVFGRFSISMPKMALLGAFVAEISEMKSECTSVAAKMAVTLQRDLSDLPPKLRLKENRDSAGSRPPARPE